MRKKKRNFFFNEFYVAGYRYYDGHKVEDLLLEGKILRFQREPQCEHDPKAVEVYAGRRKLGYVPRKDNEPIAKLLDQGIDIKGMICKRNFDDRPRHRVKVSAFKEE